MAKLFDDIDKQEAMWRTGQGKERIKKLEQALTEISTYAISAPQHTRHIENIRKIAEEALRP